MQKRSVKGPSHGLIEAVREALVAAADPTQAGPMQAYMKSPLPFLGIQKKARTAILTPVFKAHLMQSPQVWRATVLALFQGAEYREQWYAALELLAFRAYRDWLDLEAVPLCESLICEAGWWDIVDEVATRRLGPLLMRERRALTPVFRAWATDPNPWKRRTSVLVQLKHKEQTDLNLLSHAIVANLDDPDFFLRKGIGWALREFARTDPRWVRAFVADHQDRLSPLSRREALKHL